MTDACPYCAAPPRLTYVSMPCPSGPLVDLLGVECLDLHLAVAAICDRCRRVPPITYLAWVGQPGQSWAGAVQAAWASWRAGPWAYYARPEAPAGGEGTAPAGGEGGDG